MRLKKIVLTCVALSMAFGATPAAALATDAQQISVPLMPSAESGAPLNDLTITPQIALELTRAAQAKERSLAISSSTVGTQALNKYGYQVRPADNYRQETRYWCGPAAARQSLSFHKIHSKSGVALPTQATLAKQIGTTTSGSLTTRIANTLNSYDGQFGKVWYLASDITDTSAPYETFVNRIGTMLRSSTVNPTTPIILVQTRYIKRYGGRYSRHYITINGIDDRYSPIKMRSVDPHFDPALFGVRWEEIGSNSVDGLYKATLEADREGTNRVMAW